MNKFFATMILWICIRKFLLHMFCGFAFYEQFFCYNDFVDLHLGRKFLLHTFCGFALNEHSFCYNDFMDLHLGRNFLLHMFCVFA